MLSIRPLHSLFTAEISGIDLRAPVGGRGAAEISAAIGAYAVLVFRDQWISDEQQIEFSALFGPLETAVGALLNGKQLRLKSAEIADVSNIDSQGQIRTQQDRWMSMQRANQFWHTDSSFKSIPGKYSLLSAREVPPEGGETQFADMRAAYADLPAALKDKVRKLRTSHSLLYSRRLAGMTDFSDSERKALSPVSRPLVRFHRESGKESLYLASHISHIEGWEEEEGRALIEKLMVFATEPKFVFQHSWRVGDLVMWDNSCTMHRGLPYDDAHYRRDMRRTTTADRDFDAMSAFWEREG